MERLSIILYSFIIFISLSVLTIVVSTIILRNDNIPPDNIKIVYDISDPYSDRKLTEYLDELHVKYPLIAIAQMKLESADGTSAVFKKNNNLFGMKMPETRPTTASGTDHNHATYAHWRQSVIDYAMWQAYVMNTENISSENAWLEYINRYYSEIPGEYKRRILAIKSNLNPKSK